MKSTIACICFFVLKTHYWEFNWTIVYDDFVSFSQFSCEILTVDDDQIIVYSS